MAYRKKPFIAKRVEQDVTGKARTIQNMAMRARSHMNDRYEKWRTYYNFRRGDQWPLGKKTRDVLNFIRVNEYHAVSLQTERIPEPDYQERIMQDRGKAMLMTHWWDVIKEESRYPWEFAEATAHAYTYGTGFLRWGWDPRLSWPYGNIYIVSWNPWMVLVEPEARRLGGATWVFFESIVARKALEMEYGEIPNDVWSACREGRTTYKGPEGNALFDSNRSAVRLECFLIDGTLDDTDDRMLDKVEKAPYGRVPRYLKVVGDCVLADMRSIYRGLPAARVVSDPLPDSVWGESRVEQLVGAQRTLNQRNHEINNSLAANAYGWWLADNEAGIKQDLKIKPNQIIRKNAQGEFKHIDGPGPNPQAIHMLNAGVTLIDRLSQVQAATQGVRPTGVTSGVAITALQNAAMSSVRRQVKEIGRAVYDTAKDLPEALQNFYIVRRPVALEGVLMMLNGEDLGGPWLTKVDTAPIVGTDHLAAYQMLSQIIQMTGLPPDTLIEAAPMLSDVQKVELKARLQKMYQMASAEPGPGGQQQEQEQEQEAEVA